MRDDVRSHAIPGVKSPLEAAVPDSGRMSGQAFTVVDTLLQRRRPEVGFEEISPKPVSG